ncbi:autotransporter assembly complex protein TamA [Thermomonas hydrothermalis]|uniref:Translocation and assembly module subunit TamA n=1 Tax=Thermomonas hydrothermalis TaxID=213588 RepID=A0A1M4U158_9GAMM|nr:autotransporter assembly complex family protein [Thermomonas hydrothermalis]SHE50449.1 autotransporter secretion outer membrane protein TamA [Thermomonas hydrothermalis]
MPLCRARPTLFLLCCLAAMPALAAKVTRIEIRGLHDQAMEANVRSTLSLSDALGKNVRPSRLVYLLEIAPDEARQALEPFGYYDPVITLSRSDRAEPVPTGNPDALEAASEDEAGEDDAGEDGAMGITVTLTIDPGTPVRVSTEVLAVEGPGGADAGVEAALAAFRPRPGEVFDHTRYDTSKAAVEAALARHGYFAARPLQHRVEVTRASHSAAVTLRWDSGERMALGPVHFTQTPQVVVWPRLLERLVLWTPGQPYDEAQVDRLRDALQALDYFALVDVQADPAQARAGQVPIEATLTPARRSLYSAGFSYGTASGSGVSLGVERRYLNRRGHKALAQLDWAQKRKTATLQYRVPAFAWLDGWYSVSLQAGDEQTAYVDSRRLELVLGRTGQYRRHLTLSAGLHVLRERWAYLDPTLTAPAEQFGSFLYPALTADYIDVDDRLAPRRGGGLSLTLRGGSGGANTRTGFAQVHVRAQWFHGLDADSRLLLRGEVGHTFTRDVLNLAPSLRFYAGGDRSVRGYGWHELGPAVATSGGLYYTGAPNVLTASVEYERYFNGAWGAAVFVDSGNAFADRTLGLRTGVGIGVRWRSPIGPVRIDIARGLDSPQSPLGLYLNIGPDL